MNGHDSVGRKVGSEERSITGMFLVMDAKWHAIDQQPRTHYLGQLQVEELLLDKSSGPEVMNFTSLYHAAGSSDFKI